jgi:hypothetical protein
MVSVLPEFVILVPVMFAQIGTAVAVGLAVNVAVANAVSVDVTVGVSVTVEVEVTVLVNTEVGVSVGVLEGVKVAVGVFVTVAVGVGGIQVRGGSVTTMATLTRMVRALSARTGFPVATDRRKKGTILGTMGL